MEIKTVARVETVSTENLIEGSSSFGPKSTFSSELTEKRNQKLNSHLCSKFMLHLLPFLI